MTNDQTGGRVPDARRASRPSSGRDRDLRRFLTDSTPVLSGGRAILLQLADPVVAAGVRRHSDFARRPQQRLVHTLMYVYAVVIGTPRDAATATGFVNRAHAPVAGADDVDRQLWVAATLFDSALRAHEAIGDPIPPDLSERVLDAYAPLGVALRVPAERWPASVADFERYWTRAVSGPRVTDDARGVVRDLLHPRFAPRRRSVACARSCPDESSDSPDRCCSARCTGRLSGTARYGSGHVGRPLRHHRASLVVRAPRRPGAA